MENACKTFSSFFTNYCTFLLSNETKFNINNIWGKKDYLHALVEG